MWEVTLYWFENIRTHFEGSQHLRHYLSARVSQKDGISQNAAVRTQNTELRTQRQSDRCYWESTLHWTSLTASGAR